MTTRHTPGPWVLTIRPAEHDADFTVAEIEQPRSVKYRGAVTRMQSAEHIYGIGREELIANARLIAAAPEMLDALRGLLEDAKAYGMADSEFSGSLIEAAIAIRQAEGKP
jgi:hypothetical protein